MAAAGQGSRLKFLIDENLSWRLGDILRILDDREDVECVGYPPCLLPKGALDEEDVFPYVAKTGRILISKDRKQLSSTPLVRKIIATGLRAVYVSKSLVEADPRIQAIWLLQRWPDIKRESEKLAPGQVLKFMRDGSIRIVTVRHP